MGVRVNTLSRFLGGMGDISISRHPLREGVLVILTDKEVDLYRDVSSVEVGRVYKHAIVRKTLDMHYVQEHFGDDLDLSEDSDKLPWVLHLTTTGLPRMISYEDRVLIDGIMYVVSRVSPYSRYAHSVVSCLVYPERADVEDALALYSVDFRLGLRVLSVSEARGTRCVMSTIWGGVPTHYSFDSALWLPFAPAVEVDVPLAVTKVYLRDASGLMCDFALPLVEAYGDEFTNEYTNEFN